MQWVEGGKARGAYEANALIGILAVSRYQMRDGLELHLWGLHAKALHRDSQAERALLDAALGWCRYQPRAAAVRLRLPNDGARERKRGGDAQRVSGRVGRGCARIHNKKQINTTKCMLIMTYYT